MRRRTVPLRRSRLTSLTMSSLSFLLLCTLLSLLSHFSLAQSCYDACWATCYGPYVSCYSQCMNLCYGWDDDVSRVSSIANAPDSTNAQAQEYNFITHRWRADDDEFSANRFDVIGPGGWWRDDDETFKRYKFPITKYPPIVGPGGLWRDDDEFIGGPRITTGGGWFGFDDDVLGGWRADDDALPLPSSFWAKLRGKNPRVGPGGLRRDDDEFIGGPRITGGGGWFGFDDDALAHTSPKWRADDDELSLPRDLLAQFARDRPLIGPGGLWRDDDEFIGGPRITTGGGWFGFDDDTLALPREFWASTLPWNGRFGGAAEFIETDDDELLFDILGPKRPQNVINRTKESRARYHTELGGDDDAGPRISSGGFRMRD